MNRTTGRVYSVIMKYRDFRISIVDRQSRIALTASVFMLGVSIFYVLKDIVFGFSNPVRQLHTFITDGISGVVSLTVIIVCLFCRRDCRKNWFPLEAVTYLITALLPYWGLMTMNFSVAEGRSMNFMVWLFGLLVASGGFYTVPYFTILNLTCILTITGFSMYYYHYSFGDNIWGNLVVLGIISVLVSISRFDDGYKKFLKEQALEVAVKKADQANAAKGAFLARMSHEIRTPINTVLGMDELILREAQDTNIRTYASDIKASGNMLLSLINDILDFSKIEAGKMEIIPCSYQLASTLHDLINSIYMRIRDKGLEFDVSINEHTPMCLYGDEVRVRQILLNLLSNAEKYTKTGSVALEVNFCDLTENQVELIIAVRDTGIGIKQEDLEKLTAEFERIEEDKNRSIEGTGLGMSIVVKLLDLMGGRLEVQSKYGEGSCFTVHIPQIKENNIEIGRFGSSYRRTETINQKYQTTFTAPDARILIVDDNRTNRVLAKALLKNTEMQVDLAESGAMFLDMITKTKYDIIFLDHLMPEMDGMEALAKMKQMKHCCEKAVVIALTANAVAGAREFYLEAGFDDFLSKPINSRKYESLIQHYLPQEMVKLNT